MLNIPRMECLLSLYYAYIHTYINYANLAWASTIRTNLKKIYSQQKHAMRIIFLKDKFSHTKELFAQNKIFNVYQLNILNIFTHKVRNGTVQNSKYRISVRGPVLWNEFLTDSEKEIENLSLFKSKLKSKLLLFENEVIFF